MIYVASLHNPLPGTIARIKEKLADAFSEPVELFHPRFDPVAAFDVERNQYNSTMLLEKLLHELPAPGAKLIGITNVDLFIPVLTYVFGEAQLGGSVSIVSTFRLRNSFYGLPADHELLLERLEKEAVHELGHTFNLVHCDNYQCVMSSSTGVEALDVKGASFCRACSENLARPRKGPPGGG